MSSTRRVSFLLVVILIASVGASLWPSVTLKADVATLRDQLEKGLRARLPQDFAFVDLVITMVEADELPIDLVRSSFLWVRKNRAHRRYLMPYFEQVLRRRAAERGIEIPEV